MLTLAALASLGQQQDSSDAELDGVANELDALENAGLTKSGELRRLAADALEEAGPEEGQQLERRRKKKKFFKKAWNWFKKKVVKPVGKAIKKGAQTVYRAVDKAAKKVVPKKIYEHFRNDMLMKKLVNDTGLSHDMYVV